MSKVIKHDIKIELEELMWKNRIKSITELSNRTGVGRPALTRLRDNKVNTLHLPTIEKICIALKCNINELVKYSAKE